MKNKELPIKSKIEFFVKAYVCLTVIFVVAKEIFYQHYLVEEAISMLPYVAPIGILLGMFFAKYVKDLKRNYRLGLIFASMIWVFYLGIMLGFYYFNKPRVEPPHDLRIYSINLKISNTDTEAMLQQIMQENPDILVLMEYTQFHKASLEKTLQESYPYRIEGEFNEVKFQTNVVYSKYPIEDLGRYGEIGKYPGIFKIGLDYKHKTYTIFVIHTAAPTNTRLFTQRTYELETLKNVVEAEKNPKIVLGDFNLTPWSSYYSQNIQPLGLNNISRYEGMKNTWNLILNRNIIGAHIDQMLVSKDIGVVDFRIKDFKGSDHKALIADLVLN